MKAEEYRLLESEKLQQQMNDLYREAFNLRMQKGSGQLPRASQARSIRRDIARIKTIMNERAKVAHK